MSKMTPSARAVYRLRAERLKAGKCQDCGLCDVVPAVRKRCESCRDAGNAKQRARRARLMFDGICIQCSIERAYKGGRCEVCYDGQTAAQYRFRLKRAAARINGGGK